MFAPTFNLRSREVMLAAHADDESPALFVLGPMKPGVALSMERRHDIDNRVSPP